ncbi:MAG: hypothetical protein ACXVZN_13910 [Gaiellaceae bacterium]
MFKKAFIVVAAVAAMALPAAALGDGGTPAPDPGAKVAAAQAKLQALKAKCDSSPAASAKCAKVAAKVLARLNKISAHIDTLEGKIISKCSVATPPAKCSHAPAMLQKLDADKQAISQLESWIRSNFSTAAPAGS